MNRDDNTWIQTFTGRQVWPLDPRPEDFVIKDIAHALSQICRYTGHCRKFYSVGQHSIHVMELVLIHGKKMALTALLHDASEAYITDMARPVKHNFPEYLAVEHRLEVEIAKAFDIYYPFPPEIKEADNVMLNTERRDLMCNPPRAWKTYGVGYRQDKVEPWTPEISEARFLEAYKILL